MRFFEQFMTLFQMFDLCMLPQAYVERTNADTHLIIPSSECPMSTILKI